MKKALLLLSLFLNILNLQAQNNYSSNIDGEITCQLCPEKNVPFANVAIKGSGIGSAADENGLFIIKDIAPGTYTLTATAVGFKPQEKEVKLNAAQRVNVRFNLEEDHINLSHVVISGTRYEMDRDESPVMVNVIDDHIFKATQSVSLSEGLGFQPGLRIENNCQNCGFMQVRMNGLEGHYSQILVNSRPIFSALQGVYGIDQIPAGMIERVEVVRGGGSALFGGNAIAGTINIITKDPVVNTYQLKSQLQLIDGEVPEYNLNAHISLVSDDLKTGVNLYGIHRQRDFYDANADGFSEITLLENTTLGGKTYLKPNKYSKLNLDFHVINDFRRGGNQFNLPAHQTDVTEQVQHQIAGGGISYEQYNKSMTNKLAAYSTLQIITRDSYYGAGGNLENLNTNEYYQDQDGSFISISDYLRSEWNREPSAEEVALAEDNLRLMLKEKAASYYGKTTDLSWVSGIQFSQSLSKGNFIGGLEYRLNDVLDEMPGYNRLIDQQVSNLGSYLQYEYKPWRKLTILTGLRYDYNHIDGQYNIYESSHQTEVNLHVLNPRLNILYKPRPDLQIRGSYARGFRTPQAFDEDLHIETVGGGAQFIRMGNNLRAETSDAYTLSTELKPQGRQQFSILLEGFYTRLYNPFINVGILDGDNTTPDILEKQNALEDAIVAGINLETRYAPSRKFNLLLGGTAQMARYDQPIELYSSEETDGSSIASDQILRTPNLYSYIVGTYRFNHVWELNLSGNYTGSMQQPYESGLQRPLGIYTTSDFMEINTNISYKIPVNEMNLEIQAGIQNMFNSFQNDFDFGMDRDVAYMYGPVRPRTFILGVKIGNL
jgi:outer membrane receptor for ferrienterochelin and colicins